MQYKKEQSDLLTHKNKATQHHEWGFLTMKRNAKTIIAGMIALAIFIVDAFSGFTSPCQGGIVKI